jgi:O-antigen/teichoic acid export membrane protein
MTSLKARILKGSIWISGARIAINLLSTLSMLVLARLLAPADFGLVAIATTLLAVVNAVTDIPLSEALIQQKNPTPRHFDTAWTLSVGRALVVALAFAACSVPIARFYDDPRLVEVVLVLSLGIFLGGFINPRAIMLTRDLVFWQQFVLQVAAKVASIAIAIGVALAYRNYWAILLGTLGGQVVGVALSYCILPFLPRPGVAHARSLMSFSVWLTLSKIVNTVNWNFDQLLIGKFLGKADLGFYAVGNNLASLPSREAVEPLMGTLFPAFAGLVDEPARLRAAYRSAQSFIVALALPVGVGVALVAEPLVRVALGEKWLPVVVLIQILAPVFAVQTLGSVAQPLAMAAGKTSMIFRRDVQLFFFRLPFIIVGMVFGGLMGVVYARAFTGTVGTWFNLKVVGNITGLSFLEQLTPNARTAVSTSVMAVVVWALGLTGWAAAGGPWLIGWIAVQALAGLAVYASCMASLWVLAGRPAGPETEAMKLVGKLRAAVGR